MGILAGLGIADRIFSSGSDAPTAPSYQATLPPSPMMGRPDPNIEFPSNEAISFSGPKVARIDRPSGYRQTYNVQADSTVDSNLQGLQAYMGNAGRIPSRGTYVYDHRRNKDEQEMSYEIKRRLNSSF